MKIRSHADSLVPFETGRALRFESADGRSRTLVVAWVKPHGKGLLLSLEGVADRDAAEALIGSSLWVDGATLPDLEDGTYYWFELIGLAVYTAQGQYLGNLETILPTGSNDVYVVRNGDDEILIPALASVVQVIDTDQRRMEVALPEGL
jgi:16S rRNA processing protein RimM